MTGFIEIAGHWGFDKPQPDRKFLFNIDTIALVTEFNGNCVIGTNLTDTPDFVCYENYEAVKNMVEYVVHNSLLQPIGEALERTGR